jgi:hypothetical protein
MSIPFRKKEIIEYLDSCITQWRKQKKTGDKLAPYYIDAFQSVRMTLFGKLLNDANYEVHVDDILFK